jgi:hypothetical protein
MNNCCICWVFHANITEIHGLKSKIASKKSRQAALRAGI